ncbi:MAG: cytochrome c oxidase subunit II transmembrane domain-containing protein, partial [Pseudohongiellaceae bacterium]
MVRAALVRATRRLVSAGAGLLALGSGAAVGNTEPWAINLQPAATPVMEMVHRFNTGLLIVVSLIVVFVLGLLVYCIVRFNERAN